MLTSILDFQKCQTPELGAREKQLETAKKLKKLNVDIEIIIQSTGLTREEVDKL